ncbi:tRNA lysidine(34) synthetase TilS [candidate division KSB1 bacterium]|nr:tRNA lysidine(34) synthetase TilS [candidate division KSB1 bacterium]
MIDPVEMVRAAIAKYCRPQDRLLLAVSGGPDSMGMLEAVSRIHQNAVVVHVDHRIRPKSSEEYEIVRKLSDTHVLASGTVRVNVPQLATMRGLSMEHAARLARYSVLEQQADLHGANWILTGHTLDDCAETVLMRMLSGAPWYEWTGIPEQRGRILRPMLRVSRRELHDWVRESGLVYVTDESNSDSSHRRNALRERLRALPSYWTDERMLKFVEAANSLAHHLAASRTAAYAVSIIPATATDPCERGLEIDLILSYFTSLGFLAVEEAWARLTNRPDARLSSAYRRQIRDVLTSTAPETELALPANLRLLKRGRIAWLICGQAPQIDQAVSESATEFRQLGCELLLESVSAARLDEFRVRNWRPGDRVRQPGRPLKKVSSILAERKLSPLARARALVLCDSAGPLCLLSRQSFESEIEPRPGAPRLRVRWTCN